MQNKDNHNRLKHYPTETHSKLVNDTIERFKKQKMMKETVTKGSKFQNSRKPKFYLKLKIHEKGNPGRPVVSSVNCHNCHRILKTQKILLKNLTKYKKYQKTIYLPRKM